LNEKVKNIDEKKCLIPAFVDTVNVVVDPLLNGFLSIIILMIDWKADHLDLCMHAGAASRK